MIFERDKERGGGIAITSDICFMRKALRLARRGERRVHPNPLVGAVLVKKGRVVGSGSHEYLGGPHAEVNALRAAGRFAGGDTLYVTLEPCPYFGKTPPCTDLILKSGIKEVVVATKDPNPKVRGRGISVLLKAGIKVRVGLLENEAQNLNKDYNRWAQKKMPYVIVKFAQSLDGRMHDTSGRSRWISGPEARKLTHRLRAGADAILVGVNTVLKDNPLLTVRLKNWKGRQPLKVILDSGLRTPLSANIFSKKSPGPVLLVAAKGVANAALKKYQNKAGLIKLSATDGRVNLKTLFKELGRRGIVNVLVEGGADVIADVLSRRLAQEVYCFVAPLAIGRLPLSQAPTLRRSDFRKIGDDFLIHGKF